MHSKLEFKWQYEHYKPIRSSYTCCEYLAHDQCFGNDQECNFESHYAFRTTVTTTCFLVLAVVLPCCCCAMLKWQ